MKISDLKKLVLPIIKKYKIIFIVIFAGVLLLLIPGSKAPEKKSSAQSAAAPQSIPGGESFVSLRETEQRLESILAQAAGVGRVRVILSTKNSGRANYAFDLRESETDQEQSIKTIADNDGERALLIDYAAPTFLGAIVICDGADDIHVRTSLFNAIEAFCGINTSKITIIKMKPDS